MQVDYSVLAVRLENFMGFEDTGWLELRPITLLFGRNSSGKSAIIRALRLMRQSLQTDEQSGPLILADEMGVDLGSFRDMIRNHDITLPLRFGFKVSLPPGPYEIGQSSITDFVVLTLEYLFHDNKIRLQRYTLDGNDAKQPGDMIISLTRSGPFRLDRFYSGSAEAGYWEAFSDFVSLSVGNPASRWSQLAPIHGECGFLPNLGYRGGTEFSGSDLPEESAHPDQEDEVDDEFADYLVDAEQNSLDLAEMLSMPLQPLTFVEERVTSVTITSGADKSGTSKAPIQDEDISGQTLDVLFGRVERLSERVIQAIVFFLRGFSYIGPLRAAPKRHYYVPKQSTGDVGTTGEFSLERFLVRRQIDTGFEDRINKWLLNDSGLTIQVKVRPLSEKQPLYEVVLVESSGDREPFGTNLMDVGFGISQLLPVIIEASFVREGRTIIVEQPELHLHPSAQAYMADLFISMTHLGVKFIIETHSEHLLLRLQRRIAESSLLVTLIEHSIDEISAHLKQTGVDNSRLLTTQRLLRQAVIELRAQKPPVAESYIMRSLGTLRDLGLSTYEQLSALIAEGTHFAGNNLVRLLFLLRKLSCSTVETILLDELGELVEPSTEFQDFFRYDYDDAMAISLTVSKIHRMDVGHDTGN